MNQKAPVRTVTQLLLLLTLCAGSVLAQGTAFTYQGKLSDGGTAANGNYDLQFALFDAAAGGSQVSAAQTLNTIAVSGGIFSVSLDFGSGVFPGSNRYLEISARVSGGGAFTTLAPRQQISSTPYAIRSLNATTADTATNATNATNATIATTATNATQLGGVAASQYVQTTDSRLTDARAPAAGSSNYIQNSAAVQAAANFNIAGNGTAGGTISANIVNAATQYNIAGSRVLSVAGSNTLVGISAGNANPSGAQNSFFGNLAGSSTTSGGVNSFFGRAAGSSNTTGSSNSFFGGGAGTSNTTGGENAFFGRDAGAANTTASSNSFFGRSAGAANTVGSSNSFFGRDAGASNTTASSNSFFGHSAGAQNTTGSGNSFFGSLAGQDNKGYDNSFFGNFAGQTNTTGAGNAFFGSSAGDSNTIGDDNSFFGRLAGGSNTTGDKNSFFGRSAGQLTTTGVENSFFGVSAGYFNQTGNNNAFFGRSAGVNTTSGVNNSFVGRSAGEGNTSGDNNTLVGYFANVATGNLDHATAIGAGAVVATSNTIMLGRSDGSDKVRVPGLGAAGATDVCRNANNELSTCSSSRRYKEQIFNFGGGLNLLQQLRPVTFVWKADHQPDLGLVAEEVAEVEPLLVVHNDKGEIEGVKYSHLNVILINAVKEQQSQIERQQTTAKLQQEQIEALLRANVALTARLQSVERIVRKRSGSARRR